MVGRNLCIFALLVAFASAAFDCSQENTCFGESTDCNPDTSCKTLFRFDEQGNLDLYLRDFTEPMGYAAFPVKKHVNGTHEMYEYFMCIPHHGQLLRGFAELGQRVLITEQNFTGVEKLNLHDFLCRFNVAKLPKKFQQSHELSVSIGIFEKPHVIATGVQFHNLKPSGIRSTHYIGGSLESDLPSIFTPEDGDALTDAIQEMRSLSDTEEEDGELEKLARKVEKVKEEPRDEEEAFEDENTRDNKETRQSIKGRRQESNEDEDEDNTHRSKQSKSRVSARNEDEEEDEYTPRRRDNSRRREDPRRRNIKSRDTEEDEESEDEYTPRRRDSKRGRPTRYEEDLEEDEEYSPKRKSKTDRPKKYDDDELEDNDELPRRRSNRKNKKISDDEDYHESEDDDDDEDYDNSSKTSILHVFFVFVLLRFI